MKLKANERVVCGEWKLVQGKVEADENCRRIDELTQQHLNEVARDKTGWDVLYVDPRDGRYWELTYPNSEWHGGGPPRLALLSRDEVVAKYGI